MGWAQSVGTSRLPQHASNQISLTKACRFSYSLPDVCWYMQGAGAYSQGPIAMICTGEAFLRAVSLVGLIAALSPVTLTASAGSVLLPPDAGAVTSVDAMLHRAAYFEDNEPKQAVLDLRSRKTRGEALTEEEEAILVAAARTGKFAFCGGQFFTNGFLIQVDGKDAVVTSAHSLIDEMTLMPKCSLTEGVSYVPNSSFRDTWAEEERTAFQDKEVPTDGGMPLNAESFMDTDRFDYDDDFLIFFLSERLSEDVLPDGRTRGFLSFAEKPPRNGTAYIFGLDPKFRSSGTTGYQTCSFRYSPRPIVRSVFHNCDTWAGVSSSLIAVLQGGEIKILGVHTIGGQDDVYENSKDPNQWNLGVKYERILDYLNNRGDGGL